LNVSIVEAVLNRRDRLRRAIAASGLPARKVVLSSRGETVVWQSDGEVRTGKIEDWTK
jgi:hypothetical protein